MSTIDVVAENPQPAEAPAASSATFDDRRTYQRRSAYGLVLCRLAGAKEPLKGWMINVSQSGVCLNLPGPVELGDELELDFVGRKLTVSAHIRWCIPGSGNYCTLGCQFEQVISHQEFLRLCL